MQVLEGLNPTAQIELGLVAAQLALPFWLRANPEKLYQDPLIEALDSVATYCVTGKLVSGAKEIAERAYQAVSACDLPSGDVLRSSGFSVAHIAMAPWLHATGRSSKAQHNAMVAINYIESIHSWAGNFSELKSALEFQRQVLRNA